MNTKDMKLTIFSTQEGNVTIYSTLDKGRLNIFKYKRYDGTKTTVRLHNKNKFNQLCQNGSRILLEYNGYTFLTTLDDSFKSTF